MKKIIQISLLIFVGFVSKAQQTEQFSLYMLNQFGINPAVAGSKECIDIKLGFRSQWVGFEGAPKTAYANVHTQILTRKSGYRVKHGLGGQVLSDDHGLMGITGVNLSYAYHLKLNYKLSMSAGLHAGFLQFRVSHGKMILAQPNDNAINTNHNSTFMIPDITPGFMLYTDDFYFGAVIKQAWIKKIKRVFPDSKFQQHYLLYGAKRFEKGKGVSFIPSAMLKFTKLSMPALDLTALMDYKNRFAIGASLRNGDAIIGMFKLNVLNRFTIGYAFDFTTSKIRTASSNSHEVMLGVYSCPFNSGGYYSCPVF